MSRLSLWWLLAGAMIAALLGSCTKNEFTVEFRLDPKVSGNYRLVYYASDSRTGFMMETLAPVEHGAAEAKCITRNPTLVFLYQGNGQTPAAVFYAERGDRIEITGKSDDPESWQIGGDKINTRWSEWRNANLAALCSGDPKRINDAVAKFVAADRDSRLAPLILLTTYDRRADHEDFLKLWNSIPEKTRSEELIQLVAASDVLSGGKIGRGQKLERMKLHAMGDSLVEYNPSEHAVSVLYFNRNNNQTSRADIDTLRRLAAGKDFAGKGRVVAISFDPDSVAWLTRARGDSIAGALHAWLPAGEASGIAMRLDVARTPWFIVSDRSVRRHYSGDDAGRAAVAARRLAR